MSTRRTSFADRLAGASPDPPAPLVHPLFLAFALTSGIGAWMVHLVGGSVLVPVACEHDVPWTIDVLTGVTAVICVLGVLAGVKIHRLAGAADDARSQGYRILAYIAIVSNVASTVLVLAEGAMHIWVSSCR